MRLVSESMVGVAKASPTSEVASHAQVYVIEHYHEVNEQVLTQPVEYNIS
jgi:hypothetical protein